MCTKEWKEGAKKDESRPTKLSYYDQQEETVE
jgi:hypothetical protein